MKHKIFGKKKSKIQFFFTKFLDGLRLFIDKTVNFGEKKITSVCRAESNFMTTTSIRAS
jgi:hypothetical protein